jgi:type IX secretion system PorP/SprF family membrane protein
MIRKKLFLAFLLLSLSWVGARVYGQQDAQYSQYMFNMLAVNPAYAGSREVISTTALYRKQWVNTPGSPRTMTFSADAPLHGEKVGVGLLVFNDKAGVFGNTGVYGSYAYRLRLKKGTLAMGLQAGFTQVSANLTSIILDENNTADGAFASNIAKFMPNFGAGLYYHTDKFYVGVSLPRIVNNKLFKKGTDTSAISIDRSQQTRHLFLMAGVVIPLSIDVKLKPSALLKMVEGAPLQLDINSNVWFYDALAVGLSYRTSSNALVSMLEVQATKQVRIGYAFDAMVGKSRFVGRAAHEIMLRYEFGYVKAKVISPRYF